jgi:hypothetical protein
VSFYNDTSVYNDTSKSNENVSMQSLGGGNIGNAGPWEMGIFSEVANLPVNFSSSTVLSAGAGGVTQVR